MVATSAKLTGNPARASIPIPRGIKSDEALNPAPSIVSFMPVPSTSDSKYPTVY